MRIFNHQKGIEEPARKRMCPNCFGLGYILSASGKKTKCHFCKGKGIAWVSKSGYIRAIGDGIFYSHFHATSKRRV